jgi:hypothetical protein
MLPSVHAHLAERFILNFRMPPKQMKQFVPVDWLEPAQIYGHAIASFSVLDLRNISIRPMPMSVGLASLSCAPRYAVVDRSVDPPTPAVASDLHDSIFTPASFKEFVAQGVSSYGRSIHGTRLTRVNLHKQDDSSQPLDVGRCSGVAIDDWLAAGAVLDSAFQTSNGKYEWEYLGLTS